MAVKGRTNNPNGRPKGSVNKSKEEIRSLITDEITEICIKKLGELARAGNTDAIKYLLDQKFGKATQRTELTGADGEKLILHAYLPEKQPIEKTT